MSEYGSDRCGLQLKLCERRGGEVETNVFSRGRKALKYSDLSASLSAKRKELMLPSLCRWFVELVNMRTIGAQRHCFGVSADRGGALRTQLSDNVATPKLAPSDVCAIKCRRDCSIGG